MNYRMVFSTIGQILKVEACLLILPLIVSLIYVENTWYAFLIPIGILVILGFGLAFIKPKKKTIYAREGFVIVGLSWILLSVFGTLPFVISGQIPSFIDALFETVSGFTTTGASILNDVGVLTHSMLFWRSFTHWIGGMGVLVFIIAVLPTSEGSNIFIMRAESTGPQVGKLVSKMKITAQILYIIYAVLTVIEMIMLLCGGMSVFESITNSLATAGTGGFSVVSVDLVALTEVPFHSLYCQMVIAVFMMIFGFNFNIFYLIIIRRFKDILKNEEMWTYMALVVVSTLTITLNLVFQMGQTVSKALPDAFFQVTSIITTTGFATVDFNAWPVLSKCILLALMLVGGCAGSTAGGMKVSRLVILFKSIGRELRRLVHPNSVNKIHMNGEVVDDETVHGVTSYFGFLVILLAICTLIVSFDPMEGNSIETSFSASMACINNVGPGFGAVGPTSSFVGFSVVTKITLIIAMLIGRLEIYPVIMLFSPHTWENR